MESATRIFKALIFIGAAAFISNILFFSGETTQSSSAAPKPATPAPPTFEPTAAMRAALDPGESFRRDGWRFEFGDFTESNIRVWVYWPNELKATEQAVEMMGKALISDAIKRLERVGFDVKAKGTSITYFFRKDPGGEYVYMLGSAGYISVLDDYYYSPPSNPFTQ